ncbi:hypothetical protein TorRG33x02_131420 [Trema orientale]|uniref:Uncharacterized protein n=1 Tax=Trema orientale TaxID=63057 RepID=A0A2P5F011_TREOI|nr:hypothetical protein TorRG33x02_131420 [Trema orientale]
MIVVIPLFQEAGTLVRDLAGQPRSDTESIILRVRTASQPRVISPPLNWLVAPTNSISRSIGQVYNRHRSNTAT